MSNHLEDISLICPTNDLESATIAKIAQEYQLDVRISEQLWGGTLGREPIENLADLKHRVVVVELPDERAEERLRRAGHDVIIIDQHNYSSLSRSSAKSSIEQFCQLIGHSMTDWGWQVAVNDRDFIPGLCRMGLAYEEMEELRRQEREILDHKGLFQAALEYAEKNRRPFEDLHLIKAPNRFNRVMGEAAQWPCRKLYENAQLENKPLALPNCLIIYHDESDQNRIIQVEYFGEMRLRPAFDQLINDAKLKDFEMWSGGGVANCFWGAKNAHAGADFNSLIDQVLSFALIQGRPLRYFATTLLFPFQFKDEPLPAVDQPGVASVAYNEYGYSERIYFLPQVRRFFYGDAEDQKESSREKIKRIESWALPVAEGEMLEVYQLEESDPIQMPPIKMPLADIRLHRFFNGIHMLSISVRQESPQYLWEEKPLWKILVDPDFGTSYDMPTPNEALIFNNLARVLYKSYPEMFKEHKIAYKMVWRKSQPSGATEVVWEPGTADLLPRQGVSTIVESMLANFVGADNKHIDLELLEDERMFVHTCMVFSGTRPTHIVGEDSYHALHSLATYVDQSGFEYLGNYAYDRQFITSKIESATYRRWYEVSGDLYSFTRYSAVYLGYGNHFHEITTKAVSTMYLRMSVGALFYRASLYHYGYKVAGIQQPDSSDANITRYQTDMRDIRWDLNKFTNQYWFHELTSQDQGIELFDLQSEAMELKGRYQAVKEDIEGSFNLIETKRQTDLSLTAARLSRAALIFAIAAIIIGYFTLNFTMFTETLADDTRAFWSVTIAVIILLGFLILGASVLILKPWARKWLGKLRRILPGS